MKASKTSLVAAISIVMFITIAFLFVMYMTNASYPSWHFTTTGQIGDTIGGLTAPIIGLLNAILVYVTISVQIEANKKVQGQINEQKERESLKQYLDYLISSINDFQYVDEETDEKTNEKIKLHFKGSTAISKQFESIYCSGHFDEADSTFKELESILEICEILLKKIDDSKLDTSSIRTLAEHQFKYRIYPYLSSVGDFRQLTFCGNCDCNHGLPERFSELVVNICKRLDIQLPFLVTPETKVSSGADMRKPI